MTTPAAQTEPKAGFLDKLLESKTIAIGLVMIVLVLLFFVIMMAVIVAFDVSYETSIKDPFHRILGFLEQVYLILAGKNALDNNVAPAMAAAKSGTVQAPPVSMWKESAAKVAAGSLEANGIASRDPYSTPPVPLSDEEKRR